MVLDQLVDDDFGASDLGGRYERPGKDAGRLLIARTR
jgi:hypothetical protein